MPEPDTNVSPLSLGLVSAGAFIIFGYAPLLVYLLLNHTFGLQHQVRLFVVVLQSPPYMPLSGSKQLPLQLSSDAQLALASG